MNGSGPIRPRLLRPDDLAAADRLREQAGWNQTLEDWQRLLAWEPDGCFAAVMGGDLVGTATTTTYGSRLAWVGMMLVDAERRRLGVGRHLLTRAVAWLEQEARVACIGLDATPLGKTLYDRMGFVAAYTLQRQEGTAPRVRAPREVRPLGMHDLGRVGDLDRGAFGADRSRLLRDLATAYPDGCFVLEGGGRLAGYVCSRPGARRWYIGPLVATSSLAAEALFRAACAPLAGQPIVLDTPDPNHAATHLASTFGLEARRPFIRMARGCALPSADLRRCFGIAGPEIG